MYSMNSLQRARMNKKYLYTKKGILLLLAIILFSGCVGDQQRVNNKKIMNKKRENQGTAPQMHHI